MVELEVVELVDVVEAVEVLEPSLLPELFSLLAGAGEVDAAVVEVVPFPSPRESVR